MITTLVTINVADGDLLSWMDKDLPTPTELISVNNYSAAYWNDQDRRTAYNITYAIDGYFCTKDGKAYLHDMAARIAYTLNGSYTLSKVETSSQYIYTLDRFTHLDRVPTLERDVETNAWNGSRNEIWNALRYKAYQMKRNGILDLEALTVYGNRVSNGSEHIKYLAKNVYAWTDERYTFRPQPTMTRTEACKIATQTRMTRTKDAVFSALKHRETFFSSLSISSMSETFSISRTSFYKYEEIHRLLKEVAKAYNTGTTPYGTEMDSYLESMKREVRRVFMSVGSAFLDSIEDDRQLLREKIPIYTSNTKEIQ